MNKIRELFHKYQEILVYGFFGVLTTLVNYAVFLPLESWTQIPASVCNVVAWAVSVLFAFLTNKPFVFHSYDWSAEVVFSELWKFVGCRVGSGVLETLFVMVTVDWLHFHGALMKVIVSVAVIVINYIGSRLLFTHK